MELWLTELAYRLLSHILVGSAFLRFIFFSLSLFFFSLLLLLFVIFLKVRFFHYSQRNRPSVFLRITFHEVPLSIEDREHVPFLFFTSSLYFHNKFERRALQGLPCVYFLLTFSYRVLVLNPFSSRTFFPLHPPRAHDL